MAHSGDGTGWDVADPADDEGLTLGALEIRDLRKGVAIRVDKEHVAIAASSVGGIHKHGSAVAYSQAGAPVKRPDASSADGEGTGQSLTSVDYGRIWHDTDTNELFLLTSDTPTWTKVGFTDRGDVNAFDYANTDFTWNNTWTELDVGTKASIPSGVTYVVLRVVFQDTGADNSYISFKKNGAAADTLNVSLVPVQAVGGSIGSYQDIIVACDSSQKIMYDAFTTDTLVPTACNVLIKGWGM